MIKKQCSMCSVRRDVTEFHRNRSTRDGLQGYCKECCKCVQKDYRDANRDKWEKIDPYTGEPYDGNSGDE